MNSPTPCNVLLLALAMMLTPRTGTPQDPTLILPDGGIRFPDGSVLDSAFSGLENVVTVAKSGAQFTSIQEALDSIEDPGIWNQYVLLVGPGTYAEQVTLKAGVSIRGSGRGVTTITSPGSAALASATVIGVDGGDLRDISVQSEGGGHEYAVAIYANSSRIGLRNVNAAARNATANYALYNHLSTTRWEGGQAYAQGGALCVSVFGTTHSTIELDRVTVDALGEFGGSTYGVYIEAASRAKIRDLEITCSLDKSCYGLYSADSSADLWDVDILIRSTWAGYGVWNESAVITMRNSVVDAWVGSGSPGYGVYNNGSSYSAIYNSRLRALPYPLFGDVPKVAHTQLVGSLFERFPENTCVGAFDGDFKPLSSSCTAPDEPSP